MNTKTKHRRFRGFTLVELLVVIGIIAVLIGILLPSLAKARASATSLKCKTNLKQVGTTLLMYANDNRGWFYPVGPNRADGKPATLGYNGPGTDPASIWTFIVFGKTDPPVMVCPTDAGNFPAVDIDPNGNAVPVLPVFQHSYMLNQHLADNRVKFTSHGAQLAGKPAIEVVVMGEKKLSKWDYFLESGEFNAADGGTIDFFKHGVSVGSNYLYMDLHVTQDPPSIAKSGIDPWDPFPTTLPAN